MLKWNCWHLPRKIQGNKKIPWPTKILETHETFVSVSSQGTATLPPRRSVEMPWHHHQTNKVQFFRRSPSGRGERFGRRRCRPPGETNAHIRSTPSCSEYMGLGRSEFTTTSMGNLQERFLVETGNQGVFCWGMCFAVRPFGDFFPAQTTNFSPGRPPPVIGTFCVEKGVCKGGRSCKQREQEKTNVPLTKKSVYMEKWTGAWKVRNETEEGVSWQTNDSKFPRFCSQNPMKTIDKTKGVGFPTHETLPEWFKKYRSAGLCLCPIRIRSLLPMAWKKLQQIQKMVASFFGCMVTNYNLSNHIGST